MAVVYNLEIDQGADWFVDFVYNQPAEITNVVGNGTTVTFTATNGFTAAQKVSITGILPSQYNFQDATIASASASNFLITNAATGVYISGGIAYAPVNLTSYTAELQLRSLPSSPDAVLTLSTSNGGITITALTGTIACRATANQTRLIDEGTYYYDIEITSLSGIVTRVAQGQVIVSAEVTR
jgi:hypothetical protein